MYLVIFIHHGNNTGLLQNVITNIHKGSYKHGKNWLQLQPLLTGENEWLTLVNFFIIELFIGIVQSTLVLRLQHGKLDKNSYLR